MQIGSPEPPRPPLKLPKDEPFKMGGGGLVDLAFLIAALTILFIGIMIYAETAGMHWL